MRFNTTINNLKAREWGLTIQEAYLFAWMYELPSWAKTINIEGKIWCFASKKKAIDELPLLTNKPDTMYRYYKSIEEKGLILITKIGNKDYILLTEKAKTWNGFKSDTTEKNPIKLDDSSEHSDLNPTKLGKFSENNSDLNPTYNNTSIDNITIDNSLDAVASFSGKNKNVYPIFLCVYDEFIIKKTDGPAKIDKIQGAAANEIIKYLRRRPKIISDEKLIEAWRWVLDNWEKLEPYQAKKIKLVEIASDINKIFDQLINFHKNGPIKKPLGSTNRVNEGKEFGKL